MTAAELRTIFETQPGAPLHLMLPDESFVAAHFHITEVGKVTKEFIDCGGTRRTVSTCVLQAWVAEDVEHRLNAATLAAILALAEKQFDLGGLPVELEYQTESIGVYQLHQVEQTPGGLLLHLGAKATACLAPDRCGVDSGCC